MSPSYIYILTVPNLGSLQATKALYAMIKKLLSASLLAAFALSASAYEVNDFVYTKNAKYKVIGENLVVNGQFLQGATGTDGWNAIDATAAPLTATFVMKEGGPNGSNTQMVNAGQTGLESGMYQKISIGAGGTYVVSFEVMGATAGFTDLDMTGGNTNYINAYYNADVDKDSLATVDGTNLYYGTNGVNGGYGFSYSTDGFTSVAFAIEAPADGNIIIDFRGMNEGVEIANVECHLAENVYDSRIAERRVAYFKKYLESYDFSQKEMYEDFMYAVQDVEAAIANNASIDEMINVMDNMETYWGLFADANFSNVMDLIPTTDGTANTGNHSANWMNWTGKYNKLNENYNGKAPWEWTTDRWCHKQTAVDSPMCIDWQTKASGDWDNIATLTVELSAGTYFWGVSGEGGCKTLNKSRWARSWAKEVAKTELFFGADTTEVFMLDPAVRKDFVYMFKVEKDTTLRIGIRCNTDEIASGFDVHFFSPVLYKVLEEGQLTPEQEAYLAAVATQLEALKGRLDFANTYLAPEQTTMPWGKEALQEGVTEAQNRYNAWTALTQDEILEMQFNYETLSDTIMNSGVRFLNNDYIKPFESMNAPFGALLSSVETATATKNERIYSSSSKMADLGAKITESQSLYDATLVKAFSQGDSLALVDQKAALDALVEEFKVAISATTVVDIDFGTQEAPATIVENVDPEGLVDTYYSIDGNMGTMKFSAVSPAFELGYNAADSLGILRVGNGEATVELSGAPADESDIVNIQFDLYVGNLIKSKAGFKILGEANEEAVRDTICGLFFSKYTGDSEINTFGIDYKGKINGVGSSSQSNAYIAGSGNKTHFDIVLDYGARVMYCTTSGSKGTVTTEKVALKAINPRLFVLYSNYSNADRRCWFDNLIVKNIAADATGVNEVESVEKAADNDAIYNVAGQKISAPVKGQIYIQGGVAKIAQ